MGDSDSQGHLIPDTAGLPAGIVT